VNKSLAVLEADSEVGSEAEADSVPEAETVTLFAMLNGPSCPRLI
jgi:hypothetical protein